MKWLAAGLLVALAASPGRAQSLRDECTRASRPEVEAFCRDVADAVLILQPRVAVALAGGNPVPGTASTLGMRIGTLPRMSLALRVSATEVDLPAIERLAGGADVRFPVGSIALDASLGVFQGFTLVPFAGGTGSIDLLGSVGTIPLPRGEGFDDRSPFSWAAGARIGLLRESFVAPGISVSAMYRRLGGIRYGSETLVDPESFFRVDDYRVVSMRGTVGKRVLGFGLTGGIAHDRSSANVFARVRDPAVLDPGRTLDLQARDVQTNRTAVFGNAAFTFLIMSVVGELGWQTGGRAFEEGTDKLEKGAVFGGLAVRIAI